MSCDTTLVKYDYNNQSSDGMFMSTMSAPWLGRFSTSFAYLQCPSHAERRRRRRRRRLFVLMAEVTAAIVTR